MSQDFREPETITAHILPRPISVSAAQTYNIDYALFHPHQIDRKKAPRDAQMSDVKWKDFGQTLDVIAVGAFQEKGTPCVSGRSTRRLTTLENCRKEFMKTLTLFDDDTYMRFLEKMGKLNITQIWVQEQDGPMNPLTEYIWQAADYLLHTKDPNAVVLFKDSQNRGWRSKLFANEMRRKGLVLLWDGQVDNKPIYVYGFKKHEETS